MTLEEAKEQIARRYTGGKHGWYDDYLTSRIKMLLMDDVVNLYAESQLAKYREALEDIITEVHTTRHDWGDNMDNIDTIAKEALKQEVNNDL